MRKNDAQLIEQFQRGQLDLDNAQLVDNTGDNKIEIAPDVMISYSLRLPVPVFDALQQLAEARGTKWSTLVRDWINEKMQEAGETPNPVSEIEAIRTRLQQVAADVAAQLKQAA